MKTRTRGGTARTHPTRWSFSASAGFRKASSWGSHAIQAHRGGRPRGGRQLRPRDRQAGCHHRHRRPEQGELVAALGGCNFARQRLEHPGSRPGGIHSGGLQAMSRPESLLWDSNVEIQTTERLRPASPSRGCIACEFVDASGHWQALLRRWRLQSLHLRLAHCRDPSNRALAISTPSPLYHAKGVLGAL